ncbi:MAG: 23S rRNA (pseudouridine(1915)-N(3))-methyltransferase RlmH [Pseudomonadota bacterium]
MRIRIVAVGRLRAGPERDLVADYAGRAEKLGRNLGIRAVDLDEVEDRQDRGKEAEAALLRKALPENGVVIALDERGKTMASPDFAALLAEHRDRGTRDLVFLIGGADGLAPGLVAEADHRLSFGPMVWPHKLARAMLAEQLYRAASILAGSPYHRS